MRVISRCLAVFSLLPALLHAAAPDGASIERGRRIYQEGTSPSGGAIVAGMGDGGVERAAPGGEVPASAVPCAGCHGRDGKGKPEGGVIPSDLTWTALPRPYGVTHPGG